MKKFTKFVPLMALALMVGCAKDKALEPTVTPDQGAKGAYVALSISAPVSRADAAPQPGTSEESTVTSVKLLIFDREYNFIGLGESSTPKKPNVYQFEVSPSAYRFFAVVNPTADMNTAIAGISANWNNAEAALQSVLSLGERSDIAAYTKDNAFPMVNAGSYDSNIETVLVNPLDSELVDGKLSVDPNLPSKISINVDRMVAKFRANVADDLKVGDMRTEAGDDTAKPVGSIDGVRLNVVNKKSYIYSHITYVNDQNDDYRADPNMSVPGCEAKPEGESTPLLENFFWLHNYQSPVFLAPGAASEQYVFENTANGGDALNYNNLTQLVVKATYIPTGQIKPANLPDGFTTILDHEPNDAGTWFAINIEGYGTMQMTFAGVVDYYKAIKVGGSLYGQDLVTCAHMDTQLRHLLAADGVELGALAGVASADIAWDHADLSCAILNSIPNGGYVAATVEKEEDYIVQFYQKGLNYYDIFIKHDYTDGVDVGLQHRWGMVRNNSYTLSINSLTGPGLPYIPDPTDPEIKDPQNPDPQDPEPADPDMAHIEATIVVNPWTIWTQDVDLN